MANDDNTNSDMTNFTYPNLGADLSTPQPASNNKDEPADQKSDSPTDQDNKQDDPVEASKPTDLESQLANLSGMGTPSAPDNKSKEDPNKVDLEAMHQAEDKEEATAPPTIGSPEIPADTKKEGAFKKFASKLTKVKDELVDPTVPTDTDGINLASNNPVEDSPPQLGSDQQPLSQKELNEIAQKNETDQEVADMKEKLEDLRVEEASSNVSIQPDVQTNSDAKKSSEVKNINSTNEISKSDVPGEMMENENTNDSTTQLQQSEMKSEAVQPDTFDLKNDQSPVDGSEDHKVEDQNEVALSQSQNVDNQSAVAPSFIPPVQALAPDPMGLNQPLQPVVQVDPDSQGSSDTLSSPPQSDPNDKEEIKKFENMAQSQMDAENSEDEDMDPVTAPTQSTPAKAPTLPFDPVVANPTVQKMSPDLERDGDTLNNSMPSIATKESKEEGPAIQSSRYPYTIEQLLDIVIERDASDLHITVGYPAMIRVDGALVNVLDEPVTAKQAPDLILPVLPEQKKELLDVNREVDLAYAHREDARFRINAFYQKQTLSAAFRLIPNRIRNIDELKLPAVYHKLTQLKQGLVLVTGPTGSGKSTTLAAIIQEINQNRPDHIITIEDPVEYVFPKAMGMVDQRELHEDTHSWEIALRSAMRQDPDVILVGEMRDYDTISAAITLAETGHLVFATLHTNSAAQTLDRIVDVFPEHQQAQVRSQVSLNIEAVIAQRLIPLQRGGRTAVSEIMIATPAIRNLIREAKTHQIDNVIRTSADIGMISLEHTLVRLVRENVITMERAQEYAVHPEEVVRLLKS